MYLSYDFDHACGGPWKTWRVAQVRAAYIEAIRSAHPDVNPFLDTNRAAAAINAAYEALVQVRCAGFCLHTYA